MEEEDDQKRSSLPRDVDVHFAWLRTRMSAERTLEAWMRTAVSLIGFGFTIVTFFEELNRIEGISPPRNPNLPRYIGLLLIGIGTMALAVAVWQYKLILRHLHSAPFREISGRQALPGWSPTLSVAVLLCLVGVLALTIILTRMTLP